MKNRYAIPLSWRNALLSALVTLALWGAPWMVWPSIRAETAVVRPKPPVIRYIRATEGIDGAAWSPVVFPLPTKEGFSRKAVPPDSGQPMVPVLKPRLAEAAYLDVVPDRVPAMDMGLLATSDDMAFHPQASDGEGRSAVAFPRQDELRIEWDDGLVQRGFDSQALRRFQPEEAGLAWLSATVYIELDRQGRVQHVFLENPSGQTNVDRLIVRSLYQGMASPGAEPGGGRVRLNYWKAAPSAGETRK